MTNEMIFYDWTPESMLEVTLPEPDNFLKVKETLTRIGVAQRHIEYDAAGAPLPQKLYQSCHILHKQGRYFIVHFKELFALDGKEANLSHTDIERRNTITNLLQDWGLLKVVDTKKAEAQVSMSFIKVIPFKDKAQWELVPKYNIGNKKTKIK